MRGRIPNRLVSVALLLALAPWNLGCATEIHLRQSEVAVKGGGNGRLLVRVFENRSERVRELSTHLAVLTELYRVEGKTRTLVREEKEPRWSASDLPPGDYVLRAGRWIDEQGNVQMLPFTYKGTFVIRANETTMADVVLADAYKGWVGVVIRAAVVVGLAYLVGQETKQYWSPLADLASH